MKKLFALLMIAGMFSLVACGPSAEEKAKAEAEATKSVDQAVEKASTEAAPAADSAAKAAPADTMKK